MTYIAFPDAAPHGDSHSDPSVAAPAGNKGLVVTALVGLSWALVASFGYGAWALFFV